MSPRTYYVVTPEYGTVIPILDDGSGPMEYGADVLTVRATSRQRAKVLAVRAWRRTRRRRRDAKWIERQDSDGLCPFTGLKVFPVDAAGAAREGASPE